MYEIKGYRPPFGPAEAEPLFTGDLSDPFALLGPHKSGRRWTVTAYVPGAETITVLDGKTGNPAAGLHRLDGRGLFSGHVRQPVATGSYRLRAEGGGETWEIDDPYRFGPVLGEMDEHLISEGTHLDLWRRLGAHVISHQGAKGVHFAVWAPSARRVSLVGNFNFWDGSRHVMRSRGTTGVWEIFMPGLGDGAHYKFEIKTQGGAVLPLKADPVGFGAEHPPATASVVRDIASFAWGDGDWMAGREIRNRIDQPISIYEVNLGSWRKRPEEGGRSLSYLEHAAELVSYVADMGFTHIELMPISEHPFDGSWGYQPIGMYAPTIRYGTPNEFRAFVDACHRAGLGLLLDWVPGHFPSDEHGLGRFDGTALYEHADPKEGFHQDWNTLIYNYGRREVSNYLVANALFWLKEYHADGLRVDAVASMLYRDYSRKEGEWVPNVHGGRENLEAMEFLRRTNTVAYGEVPGIMTVAEESTAFPGVSRPVDTGGLGFGYKWNMGWMNDTLEYIQRDPIHRTHHHHEMTFGLTYAYTENFILPISHDEVVHGKGSMLAKMPGEGFDKFANLRAYYGFMWGHPGKKLLFMGQEFAQGAEWNHNQSLDWHLLEDPLHKGMQNWVRDLNRIYRENPALHRLDCSPDGFSWLEVNAAEKSVYTWLRHGGDGSAPVLVACNFTPVERPGERIGVPVAGHWGELLNSDSAAYGGGDRGNLGGVTSQDIPWNGCPASIEVYLPPLSVIFLQPRG